MSGKTVGYWVVVLFVIAALMAACSGNSTSKDRTANTDILSANTVKLIDVSVDNRKTSEVHITTCPQATSVGSGSCGVQGVP